MPDDTPSPSPPPPGTTAPSAAPTPRTAFDIAEEFGTAKKNLPPVKIILIGLGIIVVVAAIAALVQWPTSAATGSIDDVVSVEVPGQNLVLVAINVSVQNHGAKPYWIRTIQAELDTAQGNFKDEAASPVDFDRYFQGFPPLKQHALDALKVETKLEPEGQIKGTIIVSFPVAPDAFASRKSLQVKIQPYDQPVPLVLMK